MARHLIFSLVVISLLLCTAMAVTERKVLFYEVQAPAAMRVTGTGYTLFKTKIGELAGFNTASMTTGTITREKLEPYDVIVMQGLNKALSTEEILAIRWYVGDHGGGLFINGDSPAGVNNLGQIFGVMMDTDETYIVDTSLPLDTTQNGTKTGVAADQQKFYFRTTNFPDASDPQTIDLDGVKLIGVYKAHPLFVESVSVQSMIGNTRVIAAAQEKAYTETGTFSVGDEPPIAARAFFGKGAVVVLADFDILSNDHIIDFDLFNKTMGNADFGIRIVQWLSDEDNRDLTAKSPSQLQSQLLGLQQAQKDLLTDKAKLEADTNRLQELYNANFTIFNTEKTRLDKIIQDKNLAMLKLQQDLETCGFQKMGGIVVTAVVLLIMVVYFVKRKIDEKRGAQPANISQMFGPPQQQAQTAAAEPPKKKKKAPVKETQPPQSGNP